MKEASTVIRSSGMFFMMWSSRSRVRLRIEAIKQCTIKYTQIYIQFFHAISMRKADKHEQKIYVEKS